MKKFICLLACLAVGIFSCPAVYAQSDSSYLDIGRIKLRKDFTQTVSIRGEDLQKIPFANLSEAINVWFHGAFTTNKTVTYVVDGVVALDPNALNIEAIAEITLVQNALSQVSGAISQDQLVLIKTKHGEANGSGVTVTGSTAVASTNYQHQAETENPKSHLNAYHQYNLSAYKNLNKVRIGGSIGWLRDVYPAKKDSLIRQRFGEEWTSEYRIINTLTPQNFDRYRFNAFVVAKLYKNHTAQLNANYVAQISDYEKDFERFFDYGSGDPAERHYYKEDRPGSTSLFAVNLNLESRFAEGLYNTLDVGHYSLDEKFYRNYLFSNVFRRDIKQDTTLNNGSNFVIENHIRYSKLIGNWVIEPSVNLMARFIEYDHHFRSMSKSLNQGTTGYYQRLGSNTNAKGKVYLVTPSLGFSYKKAFNIQGGLIFNGSPEIEDEEKKTKAFISLATDIIALVNEETNVNWKIYASYSSAGNYIDNSFLLSDLTPVHTNVTVTNGLWAPNNENPDKQYNLQLGSAFSLLENKYTLSYHFDKRNWLGVFMGPSAGWGGLPILYFDNIEATSHRIAVALNNPFEVETIQWHPQLQASFIKTNYADWPEYRTAVGEVIGIQNEEASPWSLSLANRFTYKNFSLGMDVMTYFDQTVILKDEFNNPVVPEGDYHTIALQNLYLGYKIKLKALNKGAEIFASSRNITLNGKPNLQDTRSYRGIGFRIEL